MKIAGVVLAILFLLALVPACMMWLWNGVVPDVFSLPRISYWQALMLYMLAAFFTSGAKAFYKKN